MYANYFLQNGQNLDKLGCILEVLQDNCHRFPKQFQKNNGKPDNLKPIR